MTALLGPHRTPRGKTDSWLTPRWILDALGEFDLDPCCPPVMPWKTAGVMWHQTHEFNPLVRLWPFGRVWLNPPYSRDGIGKWMDRMAQHGHGIALVFARTDTEWAQKAFLEADAVLFIKGRLTFHYEDGTPAEASAGAPSMLLAYGKVDAVALEACGIKGKYFPITRGY